MNTIEVPAQLTGIATKVDGSLSLRFTTSELKPKEKLVILEEQMAQGYLLFAPNAFNENDVPKEDTPDSFKKPSTRLRHVLYRVWEQTSVEKDSEIFYRKEMEKIIEHYKGKLQHE